MSVIPVLRRIRFTVILSSIRNLRPAKATRNPVNRRRILSMETFYNQLIYLETIIY